MEDKDLWTDHPAKRADAGPPKTLPTPVKSPEEVPEEAELAESPEEASEEVSDDGLGRGPDGRTRRERKIPNYKCHLGSKQIPPGVRRASTKLLRHRKRMAMRRNFGE